MRRLALLPAIGLSLAAASVARADEGQWTPDQIAELDQAELKKLGLQLDPSALWNPAGDEKTGGLMRAAIKLGGCSAAFVSPQGLIATNHHCAYGALQANSTPEHDYLRDGFLATSRAEELEAKGRPVWILRRVEDVSEAIDSQADAAGDDDVARAEAIDRTEKTLVKSCETGPGTRCTVASFYNGRQYRLFEYVELTDVRLVYAPPAAVGEYGGEVDNWMWPRHTGDFSLLRAYVSPEGEPAPFSPENVPYRPAQHLQVSPEGVGPGDFVAVLGYPGRTQRYMPAPEVSRWVEQVLPMTVDLYGEWIEILEAHAARDEAVAIKVAATKKGLANRQKNAKGMLEGIAHMKLVDRRRKEDEQLAAWVSDGHAEYAGVLGRLQAASEHARSTHDHDRLVSSTAQGSNALAIALDLVRRADARTKPDLERLSTYMDRNEGQLWSTQERRLRDFDASVDAEVLAMLVARNEALPEDQRIAALHALVEKAALDVAPGADRSAYLPVTEALFEETSMAQTDTVERWWKDDATTLAKRKDPLLSLARALVPELEALEARERAERGLATRIYPRYFEMLQSVRKGPIYPDANGTLRFSYATVKGYDKWDGATQTPQTVLAGAVAKHTGADPFDLPASVREAAPAAPATYWADPKFEDVPLCFLSTADTTGGNSGSPVIDGQGRLVGFNFDRVWENIAGDFGYEPSHSRNITADVRHLLWMLDEVADAGPLLTELGVAELRDAPRRGMTATDADARDPDTDPKAAGAAPKRAGCACDQGSDGATGASSVPLWLGLALLTLRRRRRSASSAV